MFAGAIALGLARGSNQPSQALPRGSIDARVASAFNTALAAGGDPVVRFFSVLLHDGMMMPRLLLPDMVVML